MRLRSAVDWLRPVVTIWVVAALALVGQAHPDAKQAPPALDLAAFALPDGSLPELCHGEHNDQPSSVEHGGHLSCLIACALAGMPDLPPPAPSLHRPLAVAWRPDMAPSPGHTPRPIRGQAQARVPPTLPA